MTRPRITPVAFRSLCIASIALALFACHGPRSLSFGKPTASLELMSFNIRYGTADDGPDHWQVRYERVYHVIAQRFPEVIGLQEAVRFQVDAIRLAVPGYAEVGLGRDGGQQGEYSSILYRVDRLELLDSGTFWLSDTPSRPSHHWGNELNRICTWALLQEKASGRSLYVFNTHFDHISQPSREQAAALVAQRIAEREEPAPAFLLGDLNADESNPVVSYLKGDSDYQGRHTPSPLVDTYRVRNPDARSVGTFNGFADEWDTGRKIDFVFAEADRVEDGSLTIDTAEILMDRVDGRWPSDHFAVAARVTLRD